MTDLFSSNPASIVDSNRVLYTASPFARSTLFHLQEIGELKALHQHRSSRSNLQSFLFFTVVSGSGVLNYEGQKYELKQSDCVFIDCGKPYIHQTDENNLWTLRWIHLYGPALPSIYRKYCERGGRTVFQPSTNAKLQAFMEVHNTLMTTAKSDDYMRDMLINQHLSALLTLIMSESWHPEDQEDMPKKRMMLLPIKEYLDSNYNLKITLDDLAEKYFINKYYLSKSFKEQYGVSVNNYLLSVRITKAKQLLRFSNKPIEQIGLECGLGQAHYFSSKFKEIEGVPPSVYREQW